MFCAKCGARNEDGAKFCRQCGSPMIKRRTQPEAAQDADGTEGAGVRANRESTAGAGSTNTDSVMNYSRRAENGAGAPGRGAASKKISTATVAVIVAIAAAACVVIALLVSGVLFPKTAQSGDAQSGESQAATDMAVGDTFEFGESQLFDFSGYRTLWDGETLPCWTISSANGGSFVKSLTESQGEETANLSEAAEEKTNAVNPETIIGTWATSDGFIVASQ